MQLASYRKRKRTLVGLGSAALAIVAAANTGRSEPPVGSRLKAPTAPTASSPRAAGRERPTEAPLPAKESNLTTTLDIELLIGDSSLGVDSQSWGQAFEKLGHSARLRSAEFQDEPGITEKVRGTLRLVRVVGRLDRRGVITFPGKTFKRGQERELKEWLDELQVYGAQGSPSGRPQWGLNQQQANEFLKLMSAPVEIDSLGEPLTEIAAKIGFGKEIPLRAHTSVEAEWNSREKPLIAMQEVRGLSRGSGFAALLADHGLCGRPIRTPRGTIEFVIQSREEVDDPWPVGWDAPQEYVQSDLLPELFEFRPIGFLDRPVAETLDDARAQTGAVIILDHWKSAQKGTDLYKARFGYPQKRTAWILVLKSAIGPTGLVSQIRIDEAGKSFLTLKPFEQPKAKQK